MDKEFQKIASIKNLFDSPGWKAYENKIKDLLAYETCQLQAIQKQAITVDKLPIYNDHLSRKNVLERILLIKEEMVDEFSPTQEPEHNSSDDNE